MKPRDIAEYLFLALSWGLSFLVLLKVVAGFGWVGAVTFRALVASATLLLAARLCGRRLSFQGLWRPLCVVGATTVAGQLIGLCYATPRIGTAMAAIFVTAIPLFSMLIGRFWGLERISLSGLAGLLLGFAGMLLLVGFPAVPVTDEFLLGCAASVFGAVCAAFGSNYASLRLRTAGSWEVTSGAFLVGGLLTLPLLFWVPPPAPPSALDYLYLVLSGSVMSALNYVIYFGLVTRIGATRTISVEFVVTVVAVLAGAGLLHERLSLVQIGGAAIILCGCALVLNLLPLRAKAQA
ncbi:DMT family transporter [Pseudomonas panipatensis]|uniref:DMT family transporter n=1 Tax=Pseudomonas panipatensis TaxID=428992 RepID=UPI0035AF50C4